MLARHITLNATSRDFGLALMDHRRDRAEETASFRVGTEKGREMASPGDIQLSDDYRTFMRRLADRVLA